MKISYNSDLVDEALEAYFNAAGPEVMQPATGASYAAELDGRTYVVICNSHRVLTVYEVDDKGRLGEIEDWPAEIDLTAAA